MKSNLRQGISRGSAAKNAEDEKALRSSETFESPDSAEGAPRRGGVQIGLRGSSTPARQAVSREEYTRQAGVSMRATGGVPFESQRPRPAPASEPAAPAEASPDSAENADQPAGGLMGRLSSWFGSKKR